MNRIAVAQELVKLAKLLTIKRQASWANQFRGNIEDIKDEINHLQDASSSVTDDEIAQLLKATDHLEQLANRLLKGKGLLHF